MALIGAIGIVSSAEAYFTSHGSGTGSASIATLRPPTDVIATFPVPSVPTVDVAWTAPSEPGGIVLDGYFVQRLLGSTPSPACGTSPTSLISTVTCNDTDVAPGIYTYTVTAVFRSWTAQSAPSGPVTVPASKLGSFTLTPSTPSPGVGAAFTVDITALDQYGNLDTAYTGPECLTFSGPANSPSHMAPIYPLPSPCSSGSAMTFVNGVASGANAAAMTLFDAQVVTLTATDNPTSMDGTTSLTVVPGVISTFDVANPGPQTVGIAFGDTITALDGYGNVATGYSGPHILVFSNPSNAPNGALPTYPSSVTFTAGIGTASNITLVDAQTTTLTVTQTSVTGTSGDFVVSAGSATHYSVDAPSTAQTATPFSVTITAYDTYGNVATGYDGTADLLSSLGTVSPTSVTLSSGIDIFNATLDTVGDQTITATDSSSSSITGVSGNIDVSAGAVKTYTVTYFAGAAFTGSVPTDLASPYNAGSTVTVLGNTGILAEPGFTFTGWNTHSDGHGTSYAPGDTFTISANTDLYAIFTSNKKSGKTNLELYPEHPAPIVVGASAVYLASVHPTSGTGPLTGSVNFYVNGTPVSSCQGVPLLLGVAQCTITFAAAGPSTVSAVYVNDPNYASSSDSSLQVVNKGTTSLKISPWPPPAPGAKVTYIATVSETSGTGPLSGTVSFTENGVAVASCTNVALVASSASCAITFPTSGTYTIAANYSGDGNFGGSSNSLVQVVSGASMLTITTTSLVEAHAGQANYTQTLTGTGGTTPYVWSILSGVLPQGLSLNASSGVISGNVSLSAVTQTFTIKLSDKNGLTTTRQFTIEVDSRPVFTCGGGTHGFEGHFFNFHFTAWGGPHPTFSYSGHLPKGVNFDSSNGTLSGTPNSGTSGSYSFTVWANNSWGSTSQSFTLNVSK